VTLVVRIAVGGSLDGSTVVSSLAPGAPQADGSFLVTIPGSLGLLPMSVLLGAIPGMQPGDLFLPRLEWTPDAGVNVVNVLGPGLLANGPDRTLVNGSAGPLYVPDLGGLRFTSSIAGPFTISADVVPLISADTIIAGACCSAEIDAGGGGGGGSSLEVQDEGVPVVTAATKLNFTGAGVVATLGAPGQADVNIPGGALPPLSTASWLDNAVQDILIGTTSDGMISVEANISKSTGVSTSYRVDVALSGAPAALATILEIPSPSPVSAIAIAAIIIGASVYLRLSGSGVGVATTVNYRVVDTIPRAF